MGWLSDSQRRTVEAALARLIPPGADPVAEPGAAEAGCADYVDGLLDAFADDPPRIFAAGPHSGRRGGEPGYQRFLPLSRVQELAWRPRIAEWQERYRAGIDALGADFAEIDPDEQDARLASEADFTGLLYEHACEGMYAAPEYGGNRDLAGWRLADWPGDVTPRGWTADEVARPR